MTRHLPLEGVHNFRDFGGYNTGSGKRLRTGRLFRSASHGRATDADLEAIAALDIGIVVDLRRPQERERDPQRRHGAFAGEVVVNETVLQEEDSWIVHVTTSDLSAGSFRDYMVRYYVEAPFKPHITDLYRRYFEILATTDRPVLIHCAAGKDRTGILAALTHHLLGVKREEMLADYLLTNEIGEFERRMPLLIETIRDLTGKTAPESAMRVAMGVEAAYLEAAFEAMSERYGGLDQYLEQELGVDAARRRAVEARLLE